MIIDSCKWNNIIGGDASEVGSGPGSYDIRKSVWHVNVSFVIQSQLDQNLLFQCCNPEIDGGGGWGIFNALLGWENSATYGSVISYNVYWIFVIIGFLVLRFKERHGHWPLLNSRAAEKGDSNSTNESTLADVEMGTVASLAVSENHDAEKRIETSTNIQEVQIVSA